MIVNLKNKKSQHCALLRGRWESTHKASISSHSTQAHAAVANIESITLAFVWRSYSDSN